MRALLLKQLKYLYSFRNCYCTTPRIHNIVDASTNEKFETVFSLPKIKYISMINRLKVYHVFGSSLVIPTSGILETMNIVADNIFLPAVYIGFTGAVVLSLASIPFRNVIGFLYVNEDNSKIKISYVDFWGRRKDEIFSIEDIIPLDDIPSSIFDGIFLRPRVKDGKEFKLLVRYGDVYNSKKMSEVLD